jgi:hypothetical protein
VLIGAKGAGLFQEAVHERGLAMINVRDDRDVSDVLHIVNDRFAHLAKITGASNRCDRETLTEKSAAATWRIAGRVECPFRAKGQARAKAKTGSCGARARGVKAWRFANPYAAWASRCSRPSLLPSRPGPSSGDKQTIQRTRRNCGVDAEGTRGPGDVGVNLRDRGRALQRERARPVQDHQIVLSGNPQAGTVRRRYGGGVVGEVGVA